MVRYFIMSDKMPNEEFKAACIKLNEAIKGLGFKTHCDLVAIDDVSNDKDLMILYAQAPNNVHFADRMFVLNTDKGVIYTKNLDLNVNIKESNKFLEVIE